ncbi:MAG: GNAT family N-acetyltransferase [Rubrobacteraceae bacterium]
MNIRPERPGDEAAIHEVNRLAFGRDDEAKLVEALRDGGFVRLSLVADADGEVVGHVLFSEVSASGVSRSLALAPVAVVPGRQREGIGSSLIRAGIKTCADEGFDAIFLLGEPGYYSRFGFSAERAMGFDVPYPKEYFMALELKEGVLGGAAGKVEYPPPFGGS